jgi:plastocyanin
MRKLYRSAGLVAAVGMLASCGSSAATTPDPASTQATGNVAGVIIPVGDAYGDTNFSPHSVTINTGGQVSFNNSDQIEHHPTADDGSWNGDLPAGGSFNQSFMTPGSYSYHCSIHPAMTGIVVVK